MILRLFQNSAIGLMNYGFPTNKKPDLGVSIRHFVPSGSGSWLLSNCVKQFQISLFFPPPWKKILLTDKGQGKKKDSQIRKLAVKGVLVKYSSGEGLQHNKFAVFDNKKVLTGSANWTYSAFSKNSENCIFLDDIEVVSKFSYRFDELWLPH